MEDMLDELRNKGTLTQNQNKHSDINESEIIIQQADDDLMPEFQNKINDAQRMIERIRTNNETIKSLKDKYSRATTTKAEQDISAQLDFSVKQNYSLSDQLKNQMVEISEDVQHSKDKYPNEPETRMKIDLQTALTLKAQEVLKGSQEVQMDFRAGLKNKITRQTKLLDGNLSDQQVEEICNHPDKAQELLQQKLYGQASIQLQNAVSDIQDKYRDILKLEQSVMAVYQLFQDLAVMVQYQGEMIDNIELNMNAAKNYVAKGEKQLQKAKEDHQSSRKKMCCIVMVGLVIIVIILGGVLGTSL